ncbi:MAG: VOC family protein [Bacteroidota bacterium]
MENLVSGIGGIFFRSKDNKGLAQWYEKHFGISMVWQQEKGKTAFAPFKADTDYFGNMDQQFMINFRVPDIEKLLNKLNEADVKIDENRMNDDTYGKFAWVYDPEGNKIELWEPVKE